MIKTMPLTVTCHGPSTTFCVRQSTLERPCVGLRTIHRRCNILSPHNPQDNPVKLSLRTLHRKCGIQQFVPQIIILFFKKAYLLLCMKEE